VKIPILLIKIRYNPGSLLDLGAQSLPVVEVDVRVIGTINAVLAVVLGGGLDEKED